MKASNYQSKVRLDLFNPKIGLDRGKPKFIEVIWYLTKMLFFLTAFPWPYKIKKVILELFGAKVGKGVILKPRVNIHFPWKLEIGDYVWIGEEVFILNFEKIVLGSHVCISQRVFLCGGNHDYSKPELPYRNDKITIANGVWIGAQSFVAAGVKIGTDAVVTAGSIVTKSLPGGFICSGNPCEPKKVRKIVN